jgi:YD repeat-containing protein
MIGLVLSFLYDILWRMTNVVDYGLSGVQNTGYGYDAVGNLQTMKYPNGLTNGYQYDALNRLTNLVWKNGTTALANFAYSAPTGRFNTAHGSAMGKTAYTHRSPVGAYQTWRQDPGLERPFRACGFDAEFPGRCPGLELKRPVGAETLSYNEHERVSPKFLHM